MDCNSFRKNVYDFIEGSTDQDLTREMENHAKACKECGEFLEQTEKAISMIRPTCDVKASDALKEKLRMISAGAIKTDRQRRKTMPVFRRYAAIAASVLVLLTGAAAIGGILLNSSTANAAPKAITSAQASEYFSKAVPLKQSSVRLKLNVRTSPNENFAYVTPVSGFVETVLTFVNKDNTMLWRIEKQNGRAIVCDGNRQYMWGKGGTMGYESGADYEGFAEGLLTLLPADINIIKGLMRTCNTQSRYSLDTSDEGITITATSPAIGKGRDGKPLNSAIDESDSKTEYIFDSKTKMLKSYNVWMKVMGVYVKVIESTSIEYNKSVDVASMLKRPDNIRTWIDVTADYGMFTGSTAEQAVKKVFEAVTGGKAQSVRKVLFCYDIGMIDSLYGGAATVTVGKAYKEGTYAGVFVPVELKYKDGKVKKLTVAARNDNKGGAWTIDGGL